MAIDCRRSIHAANLDARARLFLRKTSPLRIHFLGTEVRRRDCSQRRPRELDCRGGHAGGWPGRRHRHRLSQRQIVPLRAPPAAILSLLAWPR